MRNPESGEFIWQLIPDLTAYWSVYAADSSGEMEGYVTTAGHKRALDEVPFKRQLRFEAEPSGKHSS